MIFEHKLLSTNPKAMFRKAPYRTPIGSAAVRREGHDVTIVATAIMVHKAIEAANQLAQQGISAEVVDLRTIRPIDRDTVLDSVRRTDRLVCVYEGVKTLGVGAEISAMVAESDAFDYLDAPIIRLGGAESPIPYNPVLEKAVVPQVPDSRQLCAACTGADLVATEVIMPKVDMDMSHGRVLAWRVKEGQTVEKGEPLFDIETDKAAMEVESPASGTVRDLVEENVDVAIGEPVAFIYADGESITLPAGAPASAAIKAQLDPYATTDQPACSITETDVTIPSGGPGRNGAAVDESPHSKLRASPVARRIARDKGIDLARISGSGQEAGSCARMSSRGSPPAPPPRQRPRGVPHAAWRWPTCP